MVLIVRGLVNGVFAKYVRHAMEDIRVRFGKAVRTRRHGLGVSQEEFADMCGMDRTYIGGIERGERNVSLVNIERIARTFKVSLSELFHGV